MSNPTKSKHLLNFANNKISDMRTRAATVDDIGQIMEIISQAKAQMRRLGSGQWTDNYPSHQHIAKDISDGHGYVMTDDDGVVAYMAISFDGEPAYAPLDTSGEKIPYATAHRLAVADRAKRRGIATALMREAERIAKEAGITLLRADTNFDNAYMLRLFETLLFTYRGKVVYLSGERLAYEKRL